MTGRSGQKSGGVFCLDVKYKRAEQNTQIKNKCG